MKLTLNKKPFDFDSTELVRGENPRFSASNKLAYSLIIGGIIIAVVWFNGGWILLFKLFEWLVPAWMQGVTL